jgi:hypothetical protein
LWFFHVVGVYSIHILTQHIIRIITPCIYIDIIHQLIRHHSNPVMPAKPARFSDCGSWPCPSCFVPSTLRPPWETGAVLLPRVSVAHGHAEAYITHKVARGLSYVPSHGYLLIGFMVKQKWSKLAVMRWKNRGDRTYLDVVARRWDILVGPLPQPPPLGFVNRLVNELCTLMERKLGHLKLVYCLQDRESLFAWNWCTICWMDRWMATRVVACRQRYFFKHILCT